MKENLYKVLTVCESLISHELDLPLDPNGNIKFEKNTKKHISEYCNEVLEDGSHPMTLDQIDLAIRKKYPHVENNISSLRACLKDKLERGIVLILWAVVVLMVYVNGKQREMT